MAIYKYKYPYIAAVVRDFLSILRAEVDIERLFNIGRELLGLRRFSMSAETIRALILLRDYLRREKEGQV